eukprot:7424732-Ditylum_brightwellii.AAC.1
MTIQALANKQTSPGHGGGCRRGAGRGTPKKSPDKNKAPKPFDIHYCWTHGATNGPLHTRANCANTVEGHQRKSTLFNHFGGSMRGIGS